MKMDSDFKCQAPRKTKKYHNSGLLLIHSNPCLALAYNFTDCNMF